MSQKQTLINGSQCPPTKENNGQVLRAQPAELNAREKNSIRALVAYTAMNTGTQEEEIQRLLSTKFSAANIDRLPSRSYEDAIKFLVDLCDEEPEEGSAQ